jgi:hypothetical protein
MCSHRRATMTGRLIQWAMPEDTPASVIRPSLLERQQLAGSRRWHFFGAASIRRPDGDHAYEPILMFIEKRYT